MCCEDYGTSILGRFYSAYYKHNTFSCSKLGMKATLWDLNLLSSHISLKSTPHTHFSQISFNSHFYPRFFNSNNLKHIPISKICLHLSVVFCCILFSSSKNYLKKIFPGVWPSILTHSARGSILVLSVNCRMIGFHPSRCVGDQK